MKKNEMPWIVPLVRYDLTENKATKRKQSHFVGNLSYYLAENVRSMLEYYKEVKDETAGVKGALDNRVTLELAVGF